MSTLTYKGITIKVNSKTSILNIIMQKQKRLKKNQIKIYDNLESARDMIKNKSRGDIFAILNFDYVIPFNDIMEDKQ